MRRLLPLLAILILLALVAAAAAAAAAGVAFAATPVAETPPTPIVLGRAIAPLNGPWRFHLGDDPRWKSQASDDAGWERVDLTPKPGAHDPDVGLKGYVTGWSARGHRGYAGYAWYRLRVAVQAPAGEALAIEGPPYVDGAYQLFLNGRLLGGSGRFGAGKPDVYARQPRLFAVPADAFAHGPALLAIRVYAHPFQTAGDPESGGVHIAPSLGEADAALAEHQVRWMEVFWGYVVDGTEALIFLGLASMAAVLAVFDRSRARACGWLIAALVVMALQRGNQNLFFWLQVETVPMFLVGRGIVLTALGYGAWAMTWRAWLGPERPRWLPLAIAGLTVALGLCQVLVVVGLSATPPHAAGLLLKDTAQAIRLGFLAVMLWSAGVRLARDRARAILPIVALGLMGVGLYAQELSVLKVPGIWFPWGVGVSRTEYAYAVFDVVLFAMLLIELLRLAPRRKAGEAVAAA